ncbi:MAG: outer membrane protein transport protein [Flavobacteriaceae bacterium]
MKKYILLSILGIALGAEAQDISDVLRYSQNNINGTARFRAMGGAFTALGGDLSAISINPASSAVFNNNQFGVTLSNYNKKNESEFFGTQTESKTSVFDLNQAGAVFVFYNDDHASQWQKFTLGVNYDIQNNFTNDTYSTGINPNHSIGDFFLNQANGVPLEYLQTLPNETAGQLYMYLGENFGSRYQNAFLGYDTYILEAVANSSDNTSYYSNIPSGTYEQSSYVSSTGYNGKLGFNIATQYTDRFYFGLNLNAHFVDYNTVHTFYETNNNPSNPTGETIREVRFRNELYTYGSGFSFQLGGIAKLTDALRVGLSYESPTWYRLFDETRQGLSVLRESTTTPAVFGERIINIYPEYKIQTPATYTFGGAYVFGDKGLVSVDYGLKDYTTAKLKPSDEPYFIDQNNYMAEVLDMASQIRVGTEWRVKNWRFRGGYNYEQSPYKNENIIGDLQQYSIGLGYNFGATKLDLAYSSAKREYNQSLFNTGLTDAPTIDTNINSIFVTLLFEL